MQKELERNIRLYGFLKIFTKRVFLPLTTIYLAEIGGLSLKQIGLLASLSAIVSLLADVPTGFFADKIGRKTSLITAASLAIIAALLYAGFPSLGGAIMAIIVESLAYSFLSGAGEALMHDTLMHLNRVDDYPKIVGRAQSLGLIGNTVLVLLVPLTYTVNPRLPFIIGALCYFVLLCIVIGMQEPPVVQQKQRHTLVKDLSQSLRLFVTRKTVLMFLSIGIISGLSASTDFLNLSLRDMGLSANHMGVAYVGGSILGIIGGYGIHLLRKRSLRWFILLDLATSVSLFAVIGITRNLALSIVFFWINMGFFRLRNIMYQYHLLRIFKGSQYKATLISVLSVFGRANEAWIPLAFTAIVSAIGYYQGFTVISVALVLLITPLAFIGTRLLNRVESRQ